MRKHNGLIERNVHTYIVHALKAVQRLLVMVLAVLVYGGLQHTWGKTALAAPVPPPPNPVQNLGAKIEAVAVSLATLGRPIAILSVVLIIISYLARPILPEWANENRGAIGVVLICAAVLGLAPDIVAIAIS